MKKFIILLVKGIAIAIASSLGGCYTIWSMHSCQRMFWFFVVFLTIAFACYYLKDDEWEPIKGTDKFRRLTKLEQIKNLLKIYVPFAILGVIAFIAGAVGCNICNVQVSFTEMYALYGLGYIFFAIVVILMLICVSVLIYNVCRALASAKIRAAFLRKLKSFLLWLVVIACSLIVAAAVLYLGIPYVI